MRGTQYICLNAAVADSYNSSARAAQAEMETRLNYGLRAFCGKVSRSTQPLLIPLRSSYSVAALRSFDLPSADLLAACSSRTSLVWCLHADWHQFIRTSEVAIFRAAADSRSTCDRGTTYVLRSSIQQSTTTSATVAGATISKSATLCVDALINCMAGCSLAYRHKNHALDTQ